MHYVFDLVSSVKFLASVTFSRSGTLQSPLGSHFPWSGTLQSVLGSHFPEVVLCREYKWIYQLLQVFQETDLKKQEEKIFLYSMLFIAIGVAAGVSMFLQVSGECSQTSAG